MKKIKFGLDKNFVAKIGKVIDPPSTATSHIPDWYRNGEMFLNQEAKLNISDTDKQIPGMKTCNAFLDSISSGYMITTWADIEITENDTNNFKFKYVEKNKNNEYVDSVIDYELIDVRHGEAGHTIPRPAGHAYVHLVWRGRWGVETPKGWSVLLTHPMNQFQLPFTTMSGIMDSDRFTNSGNIPFFIKKDWTGIIEKGTPIAQIIPIKRSSWMSISQEQTEYSKHLGNLAREQEPGFYRSKLWIPKKYK